MSTLTVLREYIDNYLDERHRLGYLAIAQARNLHSFDRYTQEVGDSNPPTIEIMAQWARQDSHGSKDPLTWARRLSNLRPFMRWFQQFEPRTEVPDDSTFGRLPGRLTPHIYTQQEIVDLLAAARQLGPEQSLRGKIYETLFGLIACAGLRISEALSLHNVDVDLKSGMIIIHQTKFGKTRQLPVHNSTVKALRRYRSELHMSGFCSDDEMPFFVGTRGKRRGMPLSNRQVDRVFVQLRDHLGWQNRGAHHAPRVHDLRHSFVVHRILQWQKEGVDIDQAMLSLSTYLGHALVTYTYWYLSAVPELMSLAATQFESFNSELEVTDE
ncbi:MAG: tyrosine-type recombinase/integrase [Candidatus Marinimicrobia bacterium]|jgi:integrase|nr:tyrosine-type recombinase/integrase [Candidatus Neomarinimicrobiota bacterium]